MAFHLTVAGDVFGGVSFLCFNFSHEMSWMRTVTELNQFLRIFARTRTNFEFVAESPDFDSFQFAKSSKTVVYTFSCTFSTNIFCNSLCDRFHNSLLQKKKCRTLLTDMQ